jgi:hypothetical protein
LRGQFEVVRNPKNRTILRFAQANQLLL